MNILQTVILGIIQGLAEFMPISSSGHLILVGQFFGLSEGSLLLNIVLHLGTLIPVCVVFRKDIIALIKNPFQKMTGLLIIGTLPAVIFALLFMDFIEGLFTSGHYLWICFYITGAFLLYADYKKTSKKKETGITFTDAAVIGLMQGIALAPGISRSGSTVTGAISRNIDREAAAKFSFLLSIPVILGGAVMVFIDILSENAVLVSQADIIPLFAGFIAAAACGYFSIRVMLKIIVRCKLKYFAFYVIALGTFLLAGLIFS